jgi:ergothioneine biosynthesis protein EgtB
MNELLQQYRIVRHQSVLTCRNLTTEDYVVQPIVDVNPPKWHLAHSTWFFETFILKPWANGYKEFNPLYNYIFNSYYETMEEKVVPTDRGNLSRPSVKEIYAYRQYVDTAMNSLLETELPGGLGDLIVLGLNHEQQHQELLAADIKYILGNNPLMPAFEEDEVMQPVIANRSLIQMDSGLYDIGHEGKGFCFDNELGRHTVYLTGYRIASTLVTNGEYLAFMQDSGYSKHQYWHAEGWDWVNKNNIISPMYWHKVHGDWHHYQSTGLQEVKMDSALSHISFYEAAAYAEWKGMRLPTEFEWEAAAREFNWGLRWEWTNSAYLPYPGFKKEETAVGEYNGKFMVNQMVLRGASEATPVGHSRITYRNFLHPDLRYQYTGIRLAEDV